MRAKPATNRAESISPASSTEKSTPEGGLERKQERPRCRGHMCEREVLHKDRHAGASHREEGEHAHERRRPYNARHLRGLKHHRRDRADHSHGDEHPERGDVDVEVAPINRHNRNLNRREHRPGERKQIAHADGEVIERHEHELPVGRRASRHHRCISLPPAARRHRSGRGLCRTSTHRAAWQATGAPRAHASLCRSATQRVKTERFAPPRWTAVTVTRGGNGGLAQERGADDRAGLGARAVR